MSTENATRSTATNQQGLQIGVKDFLVDAPYNQYQIVYRLGEEGVEVGFYAYHRWASPLSRMLPKLVADSFTGTHGITSIEPILVDRPYTAILEGRVLSFGEIDTSEGQQVDVQIILSLRLRDGGVIWSDVLTHRVLANTNTVNSIVEEMRRTLVDLLTKGRKSLASALLKTP